MAARPHLAPGFASGFARGRERSASQVGILRAMVSGDNRGISGRSWKRGEVTLPEVRELVAQFEHADTLFDDDMMEGCVYDVVVVDGGLDVPGDLSTWNERLVGLVVRGDLTVGGLYTDTDDPATGVYVLGDMRADRVITTGALGVKGSLTVTGALVGFYNDYSAQVHGDVRTPCFYPENHHFEIGGDLEAPVVLGYGASYRVPKRLKARAAELDPARYRTVLLSDVLIPREDDGEEAELDYDAFKTRVRAGLPFFAPGYVPEPAKRPAKKKKARKAPRTGSP